jgi:hypothetical protein
MQCERDALALSGFVRSHGRMENWVADHASGDSKNESLQARRRVVVQIPVRRSDDSRNLQDLQ